MDGREMKQQTWKREEEKMFQNSRVWSRVRQEVEKEEEQERKNEIACLLFMKLRFGILMGAFHLNVDGGSLTAFSSTGKWRIRTILLEEASIYHLVRWFEFNATVLRSSFLMWLNVIVMIRDLFKTWHLHTQQRRDGEWFLRQLFKRNTTTTSYKLNI